MTIFFIVALTGFLGWAIGKFLGNAENQPVSAAFITAVLTFAGAATYFMARDRRGHVIWDSPIVGLAIVTIFSWVVYGSAVQTATGRSAVAYNAQVKHLEDCHRAELDVNAVREADGLKPLPGEFFCDRPLLDWELWDLPEQDNAAGVVKSPSAQTATE